MDSCTTRESVSLVSFRTKAYETRHIFRLPRAYPWRQHSTEGRPGGVVPQINTPVPQINTPGSGTWAHMHGTVCMAYKMHEGRMIYMT